MDVQPLVIPGHQKTNYYIPGYSCSECGNSTDIYSRYGNFNTALRISRQLAAKHLSEHERLDNDE